MKTVIVQEGQNLIDISVQEYGGVDAIGMLMQDNAGILPDIDAELSAGAVLKVRDTADVVVEQPQYMREMRKRGIIVISNQL